MAAPSWAQDASVAALPEPSPVAPVNEPAPVGPAPADAPPVDAAPVEAAPVDVAPTEPVEVAPALVEVAAPPDVIDVSVRHRSAAEQLRRSSEAVSVVETKDARRQTADLGEVLARTSGIGVQRAGGLGSDSRFYLNGLTDDQIRFFLDGIPLELSGFPYGIANVPVNLIERAEVFRGVVPIRFGADALGGAVNLVSAGSFAPKRSSASVQLGSFGTARLTASSQYLHEPTGWFTRVTGFLDRADNDYPMKTTVANASGQSSQARVYRFHDGYRAMGASVETGVIDRPWADRLLLRAFVSDFDKEIQNDPLMNWVYGDVTRRDSAIGASLRYEHAFRKASVSAVAGYNYGVITFRDVGQCQYDWFGQCVRMRAQPGEVLSRAQDQLFQTHSVYARLNVDVPIARGHTLRASVAPTYATRDGDERRQVRPDARDPLEAERNLFGLVSALDYKLELFGDRLENVLFFKDYVQAVRSEDASTAIVFRKDRNTHRAGLGDSARFTIASWLFTKASYEWATRLPRLDEIFGSVYPIFESLELKPEVSHNVNLELDARSPDRPYGVFHGNVNGFFRGVDNLIQLTARPSSNGQAYLNVPGARSLGVEVLGDWTSPGGYLILSGNTTYLDFRNTSKQGEFARYRNDRIPNRPYFFANGSAKLTFADLLQARDEIALIWASRYMHGFYKGFESLGDKSTKYAVDAQLTHSLALLYAVKRAAASLTFSVEAQNLTDAQVYDFFGVPRPGRAFYFKATASL